MPESLVRYDVGGGFATVTLDSPANLNALSNHMEAELLEAFAAAAADDEARAVILAHTGNFFCAGADVSDTSDGADSAQVHTAGFIGMLRRIVELPKPVIAKIEGHVRAGGIGLVAACDIAVAGPASSFALTEVRYGLAPFGVSLPLLPRIAPRAAARYLLTGERFDAATAAAMGLVTIATDDVDDAVAELCAALILSSPQALAQSKRLLNAPVLDGFDRSTTDFISRMVESAESADAVEGMTALAEKRPPHWATVRT
jgi:enoyl-CoA hydratase